MGREEGFKLQPELEESQAGACGCQMLMLNVFLGDFYLILLRQGLSLNRKLIG